jgi:hypothetical protein
MVTWANFSLFGVLFIALVPARSMVNVTPLRHGDNLGKDAIFRGFP